MRNGIVLITTLLVFGSCFAADAGYFVGKSRDGVRYWIDLDSHYSELCDDGTTTTAACKEHKNPHEIKGNVLIEVHPYHKDFRTVAKCTLTSGNTVFKGWIHESLDCSGQAGDYFAGAKYISLAGVVKPRYGELYGLLCVEHCNRHIPKWFNFESRFSY